MRKDAWCAPLDLVSLEVSLSSHCLYGQMPTAFTACLPTDLPGVPNLYLRYQHRGSTLFKVLEESLYTISTQNGTKSSHNKVPAPLDVPRSSKVSVTEFV